MSTELSFSGIITCNVLRNFFDKHDLLYVSHLSAMAGDKVYPHIVTEYDCNRIVVTATLYTDTDERYYYGTIYGQTAINAFLGYCFSPDM